MLPNMTISFAGHTIHLSGFDAALVCAVIFALAVIELAFTLGRRSAFRRSWMAINQLTERFERVERLVQRIVRDMAPQPDARYELSEESVPPVPAPRPAEWRKVKPKHSAPYSILGR